ncbi:MAG: DUF5752 family protein [Myxococcota bacterium]
MEASPFAIKDCALLAIATGRRAQTLRELREHLQLVTSSSMYHHFWGARLETRFEQPEYNNDFAAWARHDLYDRRLAERLSAVDPGEFSSFEDLRLELTDIIDERLDESPPHLWARRPFEFLRSQIVVFDTQRSCRSPEELAEYIPHLSAGSVFYHFIDARRRRDDGCDDFRGWLQHFDTYGKNIARELAALDPYFSTLSELKRELGRVFRQKVGGER